MVTMRITRMTLIFLWALSILLSDVKMNLDKVNRFKVPNEEDLRDLQKVQYAKKTEQSTCNGINILKNFEGVSHVRGSWLSREG